MKMRLPYLMMLLLFLVCCKNESVDDEMTDRDAIQALLDDYADGWMDDDTSMVLDVFADSAVIIPSGMKPIKGKEAMKAFWYPADSSKTIVNNYELQLREIHIGSEYAYTYEYGKLDFTYEKGDFYLEKTARSNAVSVYRKNEAGVWKIVNRSWSDLKSE